MIKFYLCLIFIFTVFYSPAFAQNQMLEGVVKDAQTGDALPGVTVKIKGTSIGTITGPQGKFELSASPSAKALIFSYIGYADQEVPIGSKTEFTVQLAISKNNLNEVLVVGYGTQIKQDLTGNIASVSGKDIENVPVPSMESAIQGRAAGVLVSAGNGKPGQGIQIRIRGASSVSAGDEPLYVIDGVPITTQDLSNNGAPTDPLADINPNDIASIDILKDASASAIYGSRASNGVVIITTKHGKSGKTKFTVNFQTGFNKPTHLRTFLNSSQYMEIENQAAIRGAIWDFNNGLSDYDTQQETIDSNVAYVQRKLAYYAAYDSAYLNGEKSTNWQKHAFQDHSVSTQVDLSASGGNDKTTYFASGQYLKQDGLLIGNSFERYSTRLNLEQQASDRFKFGLNMYLAKSLNNRVSNDDQFTTPMQIVALSPITPVIDPRTGLISGSLPGPASDYPVYYNPLLNYINAHYKTNVFRTIANAYGDLTIVNHLKFRTELGVDNLSQDEDEYAGHLTFRDYGTSNGYGFNEYSDVFNYTTNNYFNYNNAFGKHNIDATAGMSFQKSSLVTTSAEGEQFPSDAYTKLASAAQKTDASSTQSDYSFLSYFARATYKYNEKYLFNISGRMDASSRFGKNNRYGFFPAASAGWIISDEPFLKNSNTLSFLKLRASYGLTGNAEIGNYASLGLYAGDAAYNGQAGQHPSQIPNPGLHWESTAQADIGFDFGFYSNRLNGQLDFYQKIQRIYCLMS